jgi:hypothetical protein
MIPVLAGSCSDSCTTRGVLAVATSICNASARTSVEPLGINELHSCTPCFEMNPLQELFLQVSCRLSCINYDKKTLG